MNGRCVQRSVMPLITHTISLSLFFLHSAPQLIYPLTLICTLNVPCTLPDKAIITPSCGERGISAHKCTTMFPVMFKLETKPERLHWTVYSPFLLIHPMFLFMLKYVSVSWQNEVDSPGFSKWYRKPQGGRLTGTINDDHIPHEHIWTVTERIVGRFVCGAVTVYNSPNHKPW